MAREKKIAGILSFFSIGLKILSTLFYIPFVLGKIGEREYGLFNIIGSVIAYITIIDFGINDSTLRYFVKYKIEKSTKIKNQILGSISSVYILIIVIAILVSVIVYLLLENLFGSNISYGELIRLKQMFVLASVSIIVTLGTNPLGAALNAYEKFIFLKLGDIIVFTLTTILIVLFLFYGYGIVTMVGISAALNIIYQLVKFILVRVKLGILFPYFNCDRKIVKEIVLYASPVFVVIFVEQIYWKLDNLIIGSIIGPAFVTFYSMGVVFQKYILSFSTAISRLMAPSIIMSIDLNSNINELTKKYIRISRIQAVIVTLICLNLVLWGKTFIELWLGESFNISFYVMVVVLIPFSFDIVGNLRNTFLQVNGLYWERAKVLLIVAILNIVLTLFLINYYGIIGAAASTSFAILIGNLWTNFLLHNKVGINYLTFFKSTWLQLFYAVIITVSTGITLNYMNIFSDWLSLIFNVLITSLFYLIAVYFLYLNAEEKNIFIKQ